MSMNDLEVRNFLRFYIIHLSSQEKKHCLEFIENYNAIINSVESSKEQALSAHKSLYELKQNLCSLFNDAGIKNSTAHVLKSLFEDYEKEIKNEKNLQHNKGDKT